MDASANGGAVTTVPGATTPHEAATPLGTREQVDRDKQVEHRCSIPRAAFAIESDQDVAADPTRFRRKKLPHLRSAGGIVAARKLSIGMSGESNRPRALFWLAGFVVVFGGVSLFVTKVTGLHGAPPTHIHPATFTPAPTPTPLVCVSNELGLTGVINTCATSAPDKTSTCSVSVSGGVLSAVLRLASGDQVFLLYIELNAGFYTGPGTYSLPPWQFQLGRNDVPKVALLQSTTGTFWESVAGIVNVTGRDGRSGNVNAILQASSVGVQASNGQTVPPGPTLSVIGPWTCP